MSAKVDANKIKALDLAIQHIQKEHGEGAIMKLGDKSKQNIDAVSTGSIKLDLALGINGLPRGRVVEVYGPEASGKTTIALHVLAEIQRAGGTAAFVDAEHALDPKYAKNLGVETQELLISQPDTGEQALEVVDTLVRSGAVDVIVVDSVAALVPKAEIEGEMGDAHVGLQARLMSQALRKLTSNLSKSNTLIIFINQIREKIGTMGYGPSETTSGGRALKFYASVRLDVRRIGSIKQGDQILGNDVKVKVTKNKVAPPFKEARFEIMYGRGISKVGEVIDMALQTGVIKRSGAWFGMGEDKLGQGREAVRKLFEDDKGIYDKVKKAVAAALKA